MTRSREVKAVYPYFGTKSQVVDLIWSRLGNVDMYFEPFFGSGVCWIYGLQKGLIGRSVINDKSCFISNVWRSIKYKPSETAYYTDMVSDQSNVYACKKTLLGSDTERLCAMLEDPEWCDPKLAGYFVYLLANSMGILDIFSIVPRDSKKYAQNVVPAPTQQTKNMGIHHCGSIQNTIKNNKIQQADKPNTYFNPCIYDWFRWFSNNMLSTKITCCDWNLIKNDMLQDIWGTIGIVLDPPYAVSDRVKCYQNDSFTLADEVRQFCLNETCKSKSSPNYGKKIGDYVRVCYCGYDTELDDFSRNEWSVVEWQSDGLSSFLKENKSNGGKNRKRERLAFSRACINNGGCNENRLF